MKPGDEIKKILAPIVKGTRYENCEPCNCRANTLNKWWTTASKFINAFKLWKK